MKEEDTASNPAGIRGKVGTSEGCGAAGCPDSGATEAFVSISSRCFGCFPVERAVVVFFFAIKNIVSENASIGNDQPKNLLCLRQLGTRAKKATKVEECWAVVTVVGM